MIICGGNYYPPAKKSFSFDKKNQCDNTPLKKTTNHDNKLIGYAQELKIKYKIDRISMKSIRICIF